MREIQVCPVCGGPLQYVGVASLSAFFLPWFSTAQRFVCKKCGYVGSVGLNVKSKEDLKIIKKHFDELKRTGKIDHKMSITPIFSRKWLWLWKIVAILFIGLFIVSVASLISLLF